MSDEITNESTERALALTTGGITLLGILVSIGVTVGFGVSGSLGTRIAVGVAATALLIAGVKLGTRSGRGPLATFARWVIANDNPRPEQK